MRKKYIELNEKHNEFIQRQKIFFVATATYEGRVNLSPKGMKTLYVMGNKRIIWLNLIGSGNETAAHLMENNRITLMFCSFENDPLILCIYGTAKVFHQR